MGEGKGGGEKSFKTAAAAEATFLGFCLRFVLLLLVVGESHDDKEEEEEEEKEEEEAFVAKVARSSVLSLSLSLSPVLNSRYLLPLVLDFPFLFLLFLVSEIEFLPPGAIKISFSFSFLSLRHSKVEWEDGKRPFLDTDEYPKRGGIFLKPRLSD